MIKVCLNLVFKCIKNISKEFYSEPEKQKTYAPGEVRVESAILSKCDRYTLKCNNAE